MININTIKAGHIATVLMQGEYKLNKGGRSGLPINKYSGRVTRDFRFTISLAGEETYNNIYPDSVGKPNWFSFVKDGVVTHNKNGGLYLAGLPTDNKRNKFDLLVDNRPITEEERQAIRKYRSEKDNAPFLTIALDNVINVKDPAFVD